jgi:hypothetical protein
VIQRRSASDGFEMTVEVGEIIETAFITDFRHGFF